MEPVLLEPIMSNRFLKHWEDAMRVMRAIQSWRGVCAAVLLGLLTACSAPQRGGGYYQDDGPGNAPVDGRAIPDATPRIEPFAQANMRPYTISGRRYTPMQDNSGFRQEGLASWYGRQFHGKRTANGETYDMYAMTAAHPTLPIPSYARVTRPSTGRSVIVRVNDRGPFHSNRIIDLSYAAAAMLDLIAPGTATVIVEAISHDQIRAGTYAQPTQAAASKPVQTVPQAPQVQVPQAQTTPVQTTPVQTTPVQTTPVQTTPVQTAPMQTASEPTPPAPTAPRAAQPQSTSPPIAPQAPKTAQSRQIFLQFGAFSVAENAYRLASDLSKVVPETVLVPQGDDGLHRVLIGPLPTRAYAIQAKTTIEEITGLSSVVTLY